jgi:hypothetical protein
MLIVLENFVWHLITIIDRTIKAFRNSWGEEKKIVK